MRNLDIRFNKSIFACFAFALLLIVFFLYFPGLNGDFVLDDFGNLPPLFDAVKDNGFWYGVFSGTSGPLGRPLTLLTFVLQSDSWPNPYYFKYVNIAIHMANTILVFFLIRLLAPYLLNLKVSNNNLFAISIAFIWAILPIHVSTVLYVVQRMVLLSTFFMLAGIVFYVAARNFLQQRRHSLSLLFAAGTSLCAVFAILSKESGLLIFAYLLCVEHIIKIKKPILNSTYKLIVSTYLIAPLILFCIYLIYIKFYNGYSVRPFSLPERLLTETRVLWVYVHQIILPKPSDLGLYHDAFKISHGFFDPVTTIFSCAAWVGFCFFVIWSVVTKRVQFSFPCLWFFAGHLMESTVVPLEIYFEHRNYLASLGLVLLGAFLFLIAIKKIRSNVLKYAFFLVLILYVLVLALILNMQTKLWGSSFQFKYVHATERTGSIRARALLVDYYQEQGRGKEAYTALEAIEKDFPDEPALFYLKLQFACAYPDWVPMPELNVYSNVLQTGIFSNGALKSVEDIVNLKNEHKCQLISSDLMFKSLAILKSNKNYLHRYNYISRFESLLYIQLGNLSGAIRALESIAHQNYDDAISYARLLATTGQFEKALAVIDLAKNDLGTGVIKLQHLAEANELAAVIKKDMELNK